LYVYQRLFTGFGRECVLRGVFETTNQDGSRKPRPCDIYYHPPNGAKKIVSQSLVNK